MLSSSNLCKNTLIKCQKSPKRDTLDLKKKYQWVFSVASEQDTIKNQCDCETCKNSNYAQASLTNKAMQHQNKFYKNGGMGKGSCDSLLFFFLVLIIRYLHTEYEIL